MNVKIIHVSDLHLESETTPLEKSEIIEALATDIVQYVDDRTILCFTGDLINQGGIGFQNRDAAFQSCEKIFFDPILEKNPSLKGKIFLVPGNHEVFRDRIDEFSEAGLQTILIDENKVETFIKANRSNSIHLNRLADYKKWETEFYEKYNQTATSNFDNTFQIEIDGVKIGISCLNSAWLCKGNTDKENLLIGKEQLEHSLSLLHDCAIKIALVHHPWEFLKEFDREIIRPIFYKNYHLLLTGHVHELGSSYTHNLWGDIFISIANSSIGENPKERRFINGYSILEFSIQDKVKAIYRKYVEQQKVFVPNTDIGSEDGSKVFPILKDEKLLKFEESQEIVNGIESRHFEKLNDHMILTATSKSNYSIDNLFVEPRMLNAPEDALDEKDIKEYTIDGMLSSSSNYLVYGLAESGKTILLDKMLMEATRQFNKYNKIPVQIKFSDFKTRDILRVIREFIGISSSEIVEFLNGHDTVVFIDDIVFSQANAAQLKELADFLKIYKKVQIIATCDQILQNVIPTEYLPYNAELNFNLVFIQNFGSTQIRNLIEKWFDGREIDIHDKFDKLIKSFVEFGLPQTPLSVTLFLWIFDTQEKRPINNSVLVEMFIENILEKTSIENIYSETFDFKNKQRLLSFIAKKMRDDGNSDLSYSLDYVEVLQFMSDYLKTRFTGQPQKVLDDFIRRGVFSYEDDNLIRFKSPFFFHYFLALHFDYDPTFKEEVFTGENYLTYIDEIVYYSGLKRDDVNVLEFTQKKLQQAYSDYNRAITENHEKIDQMLEAESEQTFAANIEEEAFSAKPTDHQLDQIHDQTLSNIPVQRDIEKKEITEETKTEIQIDKVLKLAASVLKNSEDVDDFELKKAAYKCVLVSSLAFMMQYRDSLLSYYVTYKKKPDHFPKNIDFGLFIKVFPLVHQVVIFNWVGSQKLRPVIADKIEQDKLTLNCSDLERFMSIFIYADIKGSNYPEVVKNFSKATKFRYLKDLAFLKTMSYYQLRNNEAALDEFWLTLMSEIREDLGVLHKTKKSEFKRRISDKKRLGQ